jgi:hypothetical protein
VKKLFLFFVKGGGHVTSAAILDLRIFPEKIIFSTGMDKQVCHKKQPLFYLYRHFLFKNCKRIPVIESQQKPSRKNL